MYPIYRSIGKPVKILGLGLNELKLMAVLYGLSSIFASTYLVIVIAIEIFLWMALIKIQKDKPEGYWASKLLYELEKGVWFRNRDMFLSRTES